MNTGTTQGISPISWTMKATATFEASQKGTGTMHVYFKLYAPLAIPGNTSNFADGGIPQQWIDYSCEQQGSSLPIRVTSRWLSTSIKGTSADNSRTFSRIYPFVRYRVLRSWKQLLIPQFADKELEMIQ